MLDTLKHTWLKLIWREITNICSQYMKKNTCSVGKRAVTQQNMLCPGSVKLTTFKPCEVTHVSLHLKQASIMEGLD